MNLKYFPKNQAGKVTTMDRRFSSGLSARIFPLWGQRDAFGDGQPQTMAAGLAVPGLVRAVKAVEKVGQRLPLYRLDGGVGHSQQQAAVLLVQPQAQFARRRGSISGRYPAVWRLAVEWPSHPRCRIEAAGRRRRGFSPGSWPARQRIGPSPLSHRRGGRRSSGVLAALPPCGRGRLDRW